jgi:hypothetical protein
MKAKFCGVDPSNRSSFLVGASEAQHHGSRCLDMGFSLEKAKDASAFHAARGPFNELAKSENERVCKVSGGLIPPLVELKLQTVGGRTLQRSFVK